jgi:hypothetical protein
MSAESLMALGPGVTLQLFICVTNIYVNIYVWANFSDEGISFITLTPGANVISFFVRNL